MTDETVEAAYRTLHGRVHGHPPADGDRSLSAAQYDDARAAYLAERHIAAVPGVAVWPPTSQTVRKHLGGGSWAKAMTALGLTTNAGRRRGASAFTDTEYLDAVKQFVQAAGDGGEGHVTSSSFAQYTAWAKRSTTSGQRRPSGAAVRQHFGSWDEAKHQADDST